VADLIVPDRSLVVLVGVSGSGKSTFAARHFRPTQVLSSDTFRGMVADDPDDQSATTAAFDALHHVAGLRLAAGRVTVVDATNVQRAAREPLVALARAHHVLPVAVVLDVPEALCQERVAAGRGFGPHVVRRQRGELRRSLRTLRREGFRQVHVLRSTEEADAARIVVTPLLNDLRTEEGPFDVIGDVHGCLGELTALLTRLGYAVTADGAHHPDGRRAVFVGDLVDRGPDTPGVLRLAMGMVEAGDAFAVCGNHEQKLVRAMNGRKVTVSHGLAESLAQLSEQPAEFRERVRRFCDALVSHYVLDGGRLVVAHAGLPEHYHGRASGRVRSFALYGDTTGETDEFGLPVRYPWARDYRGAATVVYGHTPVPETEWVNGTLCVDTGAVFGGALTALRWPEREVVSVPAQRVWCEPVRPLRPAPAPERDPFVLDLGDVAGKRGVETGAGRITVPAERAAAALEVMSRFAVDPRWLVHLPPTMAPPEASAREGYLEHPDEAFAAYRDAGATALVAQEKHMGSRAVALVCRTPDAAARRFGIDGPGSVVTRTGRSFFDAGRTAALLDRLRAAAEEAGLFAELDTDWLLLDAELLPWSAKAEGLLRERYAPVAAAAEAGLDAAAAALAAATARGVDVAALAGAVAARRAGAAGFRAAYRRYCWPVDGLDGVQLAPFAVLAAQGRALHGTSHEQHLAWADRLHAADPVLVRRTERRLVDLDDEDSTAACTAWWEELTASGGEGMVVKPLVPAPRVQPGTKVRGREYLRLVYGPDYPAHLDRLRQRRVGPKRSLALREHALGVEGLDRLARGEPLWRVHECVFAVLALESEPVDPRL
jgi:polynucleotide kinase-phosphatase